MASQTIQRVCLGYTPITEEIKQMIRDILATGETCNGLAHELNMGYRARTTTIHKILGIATNPYKTIRIEVVKKLRAMHKSVRCNPSDQQKVASIRPQASNIIVPC